MYLYSVTAAALAGGVLCSAAGKGTAGRWMRLLCRLLLALVLLRPLSGVTVSELLPQWEALLAEGTSAAAAGEAASAAALSEGIAARTEAYIEAQAEAMGIHLKAAVSMTADVPPMPYAVILTGRVTEAQRAQLEAVCAENLKIPKERQTWKLVQYGGDSAEESGSFSP